MELADFWREHPSAAVAFSGGADSAFLLWSACQAGADVRAYFVRSAFQPAFELADAERLAAQLGAPLTVLEVDVLADPQVAANPPDRCYHCKRRLFAAVLERAAQDGYRVVVDGTNASDDLSDRPGARALAELAVLSPLRLCGLTKAEVRRRSREAGLFTWDKPAYACLATRVPAGRPLTAADLRRVEAGETALAGLGFRDFRLRLTAEGGKLQVPENQLPRVLARRPEILEALAPLVGAVTLDLVPRPAAAPADGAREDRVAELRCNLDDMTGEDIAFAAERLLAAGALDVWTTPIAMKKGRPAVLLTCLCREAEQARFTDLLLRHTTTLGVRRTVCERTCLARTVETRDGIRVKTASGRGVTKAKAEFEDLAAAARRENRPLADIRRERGL